MMQSLSIELCRQISGGEYPTVTELDCINPNIECHCVCINTAEEAFYDESDDVWLWWLVSKPFHFFADTIHKIFS